MAWGDGLKQALSNATQQAKAAAQEVASSAQSAYEYGKAKAVEGVEYVYDQAQKGAQCARDKAVGGYNAARDAAVEGYNAAKDAAVQGYQTAKQTAQQALEDAKRAAIDARYRQGLKASEEAQRAYDKARGSLSPGKAGAPVKPCVIREAKCKKLKGALEKARLADDTYNKSTGETNFVGEFQRLDPKLDQAELAKLLDDDNPQQVLEPIDSDFRAVVYKRVIDKKVEYVIGFRGTQTGADWIENIVQGSGESETQIGRLAKNGAYGRAKQIAASVAEFPDADISFTGHSLGGGLASAAAAATATSKKLSATTFNPAGLHANTIGGFYPDPPVPVDAYFTPTDFLNAAQDNRSIILGGLTRGVSALPGFGPALAAGLGSWLGVNELQGKPILPKAYGRPYALPFPPDAEPPPISLDGLIEGHGMGLVIKGLEHERKLAGCE